ncbi:helix-turn-helix domain-containing protein [Streptomyces europaeiscabiei]|uniref:helix-turn-helix domain-containing protein n=1 Tax=Streptomyces europaeiscabiei TaxID=146819 RepID=UPI002E2B5797|nr:helix-turn-helix domain-containing protein [Streptomyces europaeiscabiei]
MAEKKSGGRGYGGFHKDATPESVELAKYLRGLVKRAGKTQRDLEEPTGYGRTTISSFLNGEVVPPQAFVNKLVTYVTPPRQQPVCMGEALRLFVAAQRPKATPELPSPRATVDADPSGTALASVAATAQDQAAKAHDQLAQAHERNQELMEERGRTQQLVLSLSRFTADLRQQVTTLQDQYDEENEENEARLGQLTEQLDAAQRELRRARTSRDETEVLLTRLRKRSDELEEQLAQSRRSVASAEEPGLPPMPEELQEAFFRADFDKALSAAQGFLNDGQQRRDAVSDEWSLVEPGRSAAQSIDRLRTGCHLLGRALGCLAMMSAAALHLAATRSGADGWTIMIDLLMLVGIGFVSDPWSPLAQLWPAVRSGFRREPMPRPITVSSQAIAVRAGRCLVAGLAATGAALSVECSVEWSAWWLFPLLPATAACAMYAVFGHDRRVVLLVQEALGELGADFKAPPNTHRAPTAALGMTSPVVVSDPEWLEARRQEVGDSLTGGWSESVIWIKLVVLLSVSLVGIAAVGVLTSTVSHTARTWHTPAGWHWNDVVATIDDPVHAYLTEHSAGLPLPVTSLHLLWVASGAALLLMSFLFGGFGARTTWVVWGAITVFMVWSGTPGPARQVAAGLATVAWGLASVLAMRGLNLRSIASQSVVVSKDS